MSNIETALGIAVEAHRGQTDRNGQPYILHPLRLMAQVQRDAEKIAAVLHDVVEDSEVSLEDLRTRGFSEEIVSAVDALTKREGEGYVELVRRAKRDAIALPVKLADLTDHVRLDRIHYVDENGEKDLQRIRRYIRAALYLQDRMTEQQYLAGAAPDEK